MMAESTEDKWRGGEEQSRNPPQCCVKLCSPADAAIRKATLLRSFKIRRRLLFGALCAVTFFASLLQSMRSVSSFYIEDVRRLELPLHVALDVVKLSIHHIEPQTDISAAVCFKTLFGDIDLGIVIQWAGRLLPRFGCSKLATTSNASLTGRCLF